MMVASNCGNQIATEMLKKGMKNYGSTQDMLTGSTQNSLGQYWTMRSSVVQLIDNPLALWRPRRSKSNQQKTFEEQKMIADGQNTIGAGVGAVGASVAQAGSYLGSWLKSYSGAPQTESTPGPIQSKPQP